MPKPSSAVVAIAILAVAAWQPVDAVRKQFDKNQFAVKINASSESSPSQERFTEKDCACRKSWALKGGHDRCENYCCNPDGSAGDWCFVENESCEGSNWGHCQEPKPKCDLACGASSHSLAGADFEIGVGPKIKYTPTDTECLAGCQTQEPGTSCPGETLKVSKALSGATELKLCCNQNQCAYNPSTKDWSEWDEKSAQRLLPLESMEERTSVSGMTCLCCDEDDLEWGAHVSTQCKEAFEWGTGGIVARVGGSLLSLPLAFINPALPFVIGGSVVSEHIEDFKGACTRYCKHYPGYEFAKKSVKSHSWGSSWWGGR